ncbi:MAG: serine hydrolase [Gemmatimonadales bacterium]
MRFAALPILLLTAPAAAQTAAPPDLDAYVGRVMKAFDVPGVSLAIVKDGQVVVTKGYGVRRLGTPEPVDAHTLFGIASNTKVFTATALGLLVEEGRIEWDAPVIRYLPSFRLSDPYVTAQLTVRDLLVHRSGLGLGAGDLLWWPPSTYDRKEIVRRLQYLPLATSFRSAYAYDNVLYSVAGEVIEAVSGQSWETFVEQRILRKIGMTESSVRHSGSANGGNVASPHAPVEGAVRPVEPFGGDNVNPAGGINSNAVEMAKWVIVQLDSGRTVDGSRLFRSGLTRQIQSIVTPIPFGNPPPELAPLKHSFQGYGLGEGILDYRGTKLVTHTGGLPGFVSRVAMLPEHRLGVVVLTNQEATAAFDAIVNRVFDHYLKAPAFDWLAGYQAVTARAAEQVAAIERKAATDRNAASRPSLPLERYAGNYEDRWYGDIGIGLEGGRLVIRFSHSPDLVGDLEHWQYDSFLVKWRNRELRADAYLTFALGPDGSVERARMLPASPLVDFSYDFQDLELLPAHR